MVKSIIADESPLTREVLKRYLDGIPDVKIIGEASNGSDLVKLTRVLSPNVVFVDIEMPEINGIEAAKIISTIDPGIIIIFIASNEDYLREAFSIYAYDYILKPLEYNRISQTMNRIICVEKNRLSNHPQCNPSKYTKSNLKLLIESEGKSNLINVNDIMFITRYDRKVVIYYKDGKISFWKSIEGIKKILTDNFFCSHKGYIINVDFIKEIIPYGKKTYQVVFNGANETALMTAEKAKLFREKYCFQF